MTNMLMILILTLDSIVNPTFSLGLTQEFGEKPKNVEGKHFFGSKSHSLIFISTY